MKHIILGSLIFFTLPVNTWADCTSPAAKAGSLEWFSAGNQYRFCNGTDWLDLSSCTNADTTCSSQRQLEYDTSSNVFKYCDGTNWMKLDSGYSVNSCSSTGQLSYDSTSNTFRYCDGSDLLQLPPRQY